MPAIELLKSLQIADFPSGSSINYYDGKLYLIGDDANNLLILNTDYQQVDSIRLFDYPLKSIPKCQKADFETSVLMNVDGAMHLLILGSASREERKKEMLIPLLNAGPDCNRTFSPGLYNSAFFKQLQSRGIEDVNIEGVTIIEDYLVLTNRGNTANRQNHLIITSNIFLNAEREIALSVSQLAQPAHIHEFAGVSEVCYLEAKDMLLFTLSSERTNNSYDDGIIGDSYIGWINNIADKIHCPELQLDEMINLPAINKEFENEKIEGICVEAVNGNELMIHLVSDNDNGESKLFHVKLIMGSLV